MSARSECRIKLRRLEMLLPDNLDNRSASALFVLLFRILEEKGEYST